MSNPLVFLSYSHDSAAHKDWVRRLAEDLRHQGVDANLDQWDLRPGADLVAFMEEGIRRADRVLLVCSGNYVRKAEQRKGGAGYEGMIVTSHVARSTDTVKFIPLVRDNPGALLPDFLGPRLWLDFRDDDLYGERLEELLRDLHDLPRFRKPPLGRPAFLAGPGDPVEPAAPAEPLRRPQQPQEPQPASSSQPAVAPRAPSAGPRSTSTSSESGGPMAAPTTTPTAAEPPQESPGPAQPAPARPSPALPGLTPHSFRLETVRIVRVGNGWEVQRQPLQLEGSIEDLGGGVTLPLLRIPAGEFVMGSPADEPTRASDEGPQHLVRVPEFWMGQTPITQAQWRAVMGSNPSRFRGKPDSDRRPVEQVSWHEAMAFCRRLSQRNGLLHYTLPSEAQWEYACRAGTRTPFGFGETISPALGNYDGNFAYADGPKGEYRRQTTPVGMFPANDWGLHDMHGNVWEWCADHWHSNYEGAPDDGRPWLDENVSEETSRLLRGGSWSRRPRGCRSACRSFQHPVIRFSFLGFRVCCLPQD
jgi:formylglycine-generating enzyme required for sulfatase activity